MYVPPSFSESDPERLWAFMGRHSFATLVSLNEGEAFASHLPLLLEPSSGSRGTLVGHMARANPHWKGLDGQSVLTIFQGPHAYISPTWYQVRDVVPTWNYVAVHAYGKFRLESEEERLGEIVQRYVEHYEAAQPTPWELSSTRRELVEQLLGAIVGFTIEIDRLEGKWKLGQNHDEARRERVISALREGTPGEREVAELMEQTLPESE